MKWSCKIIFVVFLFLIILAFVFFSFNTAYLDSTVARISSVFSQAIGEKISPEELKRNYQKGKIKILIVPGHDNATVGGQFRNIKETDLNIELAYDLLGFLQKDQKFTAYITRDRNGNYNNWFSGYLTNENKSISVFREYSKKVMSFVKNAGLVVTNRNKVQHNPAADNTSLNLYAVNKWANDNNVDIVLHIHFNDYPTRWSGSPGKYSGFAIYVPEKQLPNSRASIDVAEALKKKLEKYFPKSNFPGEEETIVEDHELIAIGSNASRKGVSLLMEYGYIYEPQFRTSELRSDSINEFAFQTYQGIKEYFTPYIMPNNTTLLPYTWKRALGKSQTSSKDVLHLQSALCAEGLYPPAGKTLSSCPMSGIYGNCTFSAVKSFQAKYGISAVGVVGPQTLEKLNELY